MSCLADESRVPTMVGPADELMKKQESAIPMTGHGRLVRGCLRILAGIYCI